MVVGTLSLVQKGQTSGCSDTVDNVPTTIYHYSTASTVYCMHCILRPLCIVSSVYCVHCIHWFDLSAPKTMSPPLYTTILLRTASTGLTFLHQGQCPTIIYHYSTAYCIHCILHPLRTASTASTMYCVHFVTASTESIGLTFLHQ